MKFGTIMKSVKFHLSFQVSKTSILIVHFDDFFDEKFSETAAGGT